MESALYAPGGYYRVRDPRRDYYTAPDLHPAFGEILAGEIALRLERLESQGRRPPWSVVEMGSGSGVLARQVLLALRRLRPDWIGRLRFVLVERSRERLLESMVRVPSVGIPALGFETLESVEPCAGVFYSNELVDAFPAHVIQKDGGRLLEVCRGAGGATVLRPIGDARLALEARRHQGLPEGGRRAVCLEARDWMGAVSDRLSAGALVTIDYGSRYAPDAPTAPVSFRRHALRAAGPPPADCDVTAPVDFGPLIEEGERRGLRLERYVSLCRFLIDGGILGRLERADPLRERPRLKTLFHPDGMGEAFKVLVQSR